MDRHAMPMPVDRKVLTKTRLGAFVLQSARYQVEESTLNIAEMLMHKIEAYCLTDHLVSETKTVAVEVPTTWWQHLKSEGLEEGLWLWRKITARWPVRKRVIEVEVTFEAKALYPQAMVPMPDDIGRPIFVERYDVTREDES